MRLIDVDALIYRLKPYAHKYDDDDELPYSFIYDSFIYEIKQEPTVDAVPVKHGKWLDRSKEGVLYTFWERYTCSVCGNHADNTDYCPNCGTRMDTDETD